MSTKHDPHKWRQEFPWLTQEIRNSMSHQMEIDNFVAKLMFAPRLVGNQVHALPPGRPAHVIHLDRLPGAPKDWVRSRGSYVVPVDTGIGLWFDFRNGANDINVAVLPSVKGMNPITGQKLDALRLEAYTEKCPVHKEPFKGGGRLCEKCGWEWPPQSYLTYDSILWWDSFRIGKEGGRQFFFSEDDKRDIASLVIGKDNTVPAFGFAFWRPKNVRMLPERTLSRGTLNSMQLMDFEGVADVLDTPLENYTYTTWASDSTNTGCTPICQYLSHNGKAKSALGSIYEESSLGVTPTTTGTSYCSTLTPTPTLTGTPPLHTPPPDPTPTSTPPDGWHKCGKQPRAMKSGRSKNASVSVGAGAEIDQKLQMDSLGVEGWQEEPGAIIRLYFAFEEQFLDIVHSAGGIAKLEGEKEGYLKGLPVG